MKFLVDAQLPRRLCVLLCENGHDALHTLDLPERNATTDQTINELSLKDERIVVSKDTDFFYSHFLSGRPWKLLMIKTGNISNQALCELIARNMQQIVAALDTHTLVEIDRAAVKPIR